MKILAIETSCDETAVALVEATGDLSNPKIKVLSKAIHSQIEDHKEFGGVFPSLAKREHARNIVPVTKEVISSQSSGINIEKEKLDEIEKILEREPWLFENTKNFLECTEKPNINMLAVTSGPGLEPALWVGINFAKALSLAWNIPLIPVNHMEGHIISTLIDSGEVEFPALALLISGGHTELVEIKEWNNYEIIGKTKDDAVGESYDKVARMIGIPYPGGPELSALAQKARAQSSAMRAQEKIDFPRPMINSDDLDFSFSGLKTSVLYKIQSLGELSDEQKMIIAREFEEAVTDVLIKKVSKAFQKNNYKSLIVAGGVVANKYIREKLTALAKENKVEPLFPAFEDCTDNAQMIGASAFIKSFKKSPVVNPEIVADGNLEY